MPLSVSARRARSPSLPGFFAAAASFLAGIFSPFLTPSSRWRAPGCFTAPAIQFLPIHRPPHIRHEPAQHLGPLIARHGAQRLPVGLGEVQTGPRPALAINARPEAWRLHDVL